MKKWVEEFPLPQGVPPQTLPPRPSEPAAGDAVAQAALLEWTKLVHARNQWIQAARKHEIARCVDDLSAKPQKTSAEMIAWLMGMSWLEGTLVPDTDIFSSLFGGL